MRKSSSQHTILNIERKYHLVVCKNTHDAVKAFAGVRNMTITEATQRLLIKALTKLKEEKDTIRDNELEECGWEIIHVPG